MKKQFLSVLAGIAFLLCSSIAFAQTKPSIAPWASDKGYWVVESPNTLTHTVRFFNNNDVLVYTEQLQGVKLNVERRKVKMQLRKALETSVLAWEQSKQPAANRDYVASVLK